MYRRYARYYCEINFHRDDHARGLFMTRPNIYDETNPSEASNSVKCTLPPNMKKNYDVILWKNNFF